MQLEPQSLIYANLRQLHNGSWVRVRALDGTLAYYGWDKIKPVLHPDAPPTGIVVNGVRYVQFRKVRITGGVPMRICRTDSKKSTPAGMTNRFRISKNCTSIDLARLAVHTQGDWRWMTNKRGVRIDRADWLDFAAKLGIT